MLTAQGFSSSTFIFDLVKKEPVFYVAQNSQIVSRDSSFKSILLRILLKKMPAPPISALEQIARIEPEQVNLIRQRILEQSSSASADYEPSDLELIRTNDWQIQRFLLEAKMNTEQACKQLTAALEWRKKVGVVWQRADDFPAEYYRSAYIREYGRDVNGAQVILFRANIHRKVGSEWSERLKQFFVYQMEQIDSNNDGHGK